MSLVTVVSVCHIKVYRPCWLVIEWQMDHSCSSYNLTFHIWFWKFSQFRSVFLLSWLCQLWHSSAFLCHFSFWYSAWMQFIIKKPPNIDSLTYWSVHQIVQMKSLPYWALHLLFALLSFYRSGYCSVLFLNGVKTMGFANCKYAVILYAF